MAAVELITAAHHHASAGDIATSEVTAYQLALRGIPVLPREVATGSRTALIGGGHVLGNHRHGGAQYHLPGRHLLNAVGLLDRSFDYRYLREYLYVSVRDAQAAAVLEGQGIASEQVPCPATLIEPLSESVWLSSSQLGQFVETCRDRILIDANPLVLARISPATGVVALQTQAWVSHRQHMVCPMLPPILTPRMIATVMSVGSCVVTQSLHAAIFAVAVETPLCVLADPTQAQGRKLRDYFLRAGFPELLWDGRSPPQQQAIALLDRLRAMSAIERQRAEQHLDRMAEICRDLSES